jgi:hypothetical protein
VLRQRKEGTKRRRRPQPFRRLRRRVLRGQEAARHGTPPEELRRHTRATPGLGYGIGLLVSLLVWAGVVYLLIRLL